ncbi:MAG TPA: 50S ribosomal protein L36 [Candidatus Paceibacterota bacterium]|nr:50S ribosomal protein L36 [Candidatus Paceibacterota bacterium]HMP18756.1 50S ribosomal protein L36 [Candidatus Paceibacterota bacterium]HMP85317.1 50S ribosomal protein L36 [Candidatus Paceibacterota bacterium]
MKIKSAIKARCKNCKIVKRRGNLYITCKNPRHKQKQG